MIDEHRVVNKPDDTRLGFFGFFFPRLTFCVIFSESVFRVKWDK